MRVVHGSREEAIEALINTWLKDPKLRCGFCGEDFDPDLHMVIEEDKAKYQCCEQPYIETNAGILKQFKKELEVRRDEQKNKFASTGNKNTNMRVKLTFPPGLLSFLEASFMALYNEELFNKEYDTTWFAKKFEKYFAVAEVI